jgi:hypothetical protein
MTEDHDKLIELLREAERLAGSLKEPMVSYMIRMAIMEVENRNR